eukprot:TRINITY_DN1332_c1_g1_i3.p2 TRINITY_DN1332_c1_g1~~TRINITY_DN1332_c1_g1_i3.p2  ORF type:complete len:241 (-),score=84.46 TRINITY_DN1332_c1_g1_i3:71-793(-)
MAIKISGLHETRDSPDTARRPKSHSISNEISEENYVNNPKVNTEKQREYQRRLVRAQKTNLDAIAKLNVLHCLGQNENGQSVVVITGRNIPRKVDFDKLLMYIIRTLDPIVQQGPYMMVYCHSEMGSRSLPNFSFLRSLQDVFDYKYGKNVKGLYVLHPTFFLKLFFSFMNPFLSSKFKSRMRYCESVRELYNYFPAKLLGLTEEVLKYDERQNGSKWSEDLKTSSPAVPQSQELPDIEL